MSRGYLARLRAGLRDPGADLVALLTLLATNSGRRIAVLRRSWEARGETKPAA